MEVRKTTSNYGYVMYISKKDWNNMDFVWLLTETIKVSVFYYRC
nr:hypothetical protein [Lactobacillus bombicola]